MQNAGESQAEWFADGLLERLTDQHDPVTRALLTGAVLYVVPNANPDGTWRGHLRTNANGANLNRCWAAPGADAPEVAHLLREMDARGVDMLGAARFPAPPSPADSSRLQPHLDRDHLHHMHVKVARLGRASFFSKATKHALRQPKPTF